MKARQEYVTISMSNHCMLLRGNLTCLRQLGSSAFAGSFLNYEVVNVGTDSVIARPLANTLPAHQSDSLGSGSQSLGETIAGSCGISRLFSFDF